MVLKCHQSSSPNCRGEVLTAQCMADACGRPLQACFMKHKRLDWLCAQAWLRRASVVTNIPDRRNWQHLRSVRSCRSTSCSFGVYQDPMAAG